MKLMFLAFAFLTTFANPTQVGVEEVNIAMNPDTSNLLQIPLLMDSFNQLDLNHDGLLDKTERKPLKIGMYLSAATLYSEGDHVTRELFVKDVSVPDFANQDGSEEQCLHEDAVISTTPEELWTAIAGNEAWMTVTDFADALYDISEGDFGITYATFQQFATSHTMPEDFHANDQFTLVKLSDYTESHNTKCQVTAVRRRKLFMEAVGAVAATVGRAVGIAAVGAVAECAVQAGMHYAFPNGWLHQLYNEGCNKNVFLTDFAFNLGAQAFTGVGLWAWGSASSYLGWGAVTTAGTGSSVPAIELGAPLLQSTATQTASEVVSTSTSGTQTVLQTVGSIIGI